MALTIPFPVIPIKITFGKEREKALPIVSSTDHDTNGGLHFPIEKHKPQNRKGGRKKRP